MSTPTAKQPFWKTVGLPAPHTPMSLDDYLQLPETTVSMERLGGVVVYPHWNEVHMTPAPTPIHQDVVLRIGAWLLAYSREAGGSAHIAPVDVVLPGGDVVQPDVMWLAPDSRCVRMEKRFRGVPELVIEVISPGSAGYDRSDKYALYKRSGVGEYWIVDPVHQTVEVWTLVEGVFERQDAYRLSDTFTSVTLDVAVGVNTLLLG